MEDRKENNYYEMIVPYLDDELTVGEKELFEKALENDEELQAEFGRIAEVRTALLYANAPEPPQGLEDEIISSIRSKKKFTPASSPFVKIAAVAACLLFIGLAFAFHGNFAPEDNTEEAHATSPAEIVEAPSDAGKANEKAELSKREDWSAENDSVEKLEITPDMLQEEEAEKELLEDSEVTQRSGVGKSSAATTKKNDTKNKNAEGNERPAEESRDTDKTDAVPQPKATTVPRTGGYLGKGGNRTTNGPERTRRLSKTESRTVAEPLYHYFNSDGSELFVKGGRLTLKAEKEITLHLPHIGSVVLEKGCEISLAVRDVQTDEVVELPGLALESAARKLEVLIAVKDGTCAFQADGQSTSLKKGATYSLCYGAQPESIVE